MNVWEFRVLQRESARFQKFDWLAVSAVYIIWDGGGMMIVLELRQKKKREARSCSRPTDDGFSTRPSWSIRNLVAGGGCYTRVVSHHNAYICELRPLVDQDNLAWGQWYREAWEEERADQGAPVLEDRFSWSLTAQVRCSCERSIPFAIMY